MTEIPQLVTIIAEVTGLAGVILAAAYGTYQKWVKPWAERIDARTESTDNAVNHGRMIRVESSLTTGSNRMDRIETRIDDHRRASDERFDMLQKGQRAILDALLERD